MAKDTKPASPATTPDLEELLNQLAAAEGLAAAQKDRLDVLETEAGALMQENEALRQQLASRQEQVNSARIVPLNTAKRTPADLPTFEADGKQYQFKVHAFRLDGRKFTAAEAAEDTALRLLVVEKYPGLVREV